MRLDRSLGFVLASLLIVVVAACPTPKGGTDSDSTSGTGDTDVGSSSATGATGSTGATGTSSTDPTVTSTEAVTSDGCEGGCNLAPVCGEPCNCCCSCGAGETLCEQGAGGAVVLRCVEDGSCFEREPCGAGEQCVEAGGSASCSGAGACADIEAEYDAIINDPANKGCADIAECKVISGDCGVGLGGCHYAVAQKFDATPLDVLAMKYSDMGCTSGVCDCAGPPPLACVDGLCGFEE